MNTHASFSPKAVLILAPERGSRQIAQGVVRGTRTNPGSNVGQFEPQRGVQNAAGFRSLPILNAPPGLRIIFPFTQGLRFVPHRYTLGYLPATPLGQEQQHSQRSNR